MSDAPDMSATLVRIREALTASGVTHVFIGALPVLAWGRPRGTTDFDLVAFCAPPDLVRLTTAFAAQGIERKRDLPSSDSSDPLPDMVIFWTNESPSVRVDVFIAKLDFERAVLETAKEATILGSRLLVASCEASIIYKLVAGRTKDIADIESLFDARAAAGDEVDWSFLDRWASEWEISDKLVPYREKYG